MTVADANVSAHVDATRSSVTAESIKTLAGTIRTRISSAAYAVWRPEPTVQLDEAWRPFAHAVPAEIKALFPGSVAAFIPAVVIRNIQFLDVCAGKARISRWAMLHGLTAAAVDCDYGDHMDINSDIGLALLIILALRVVVGGLIFMGPQCSSWIWMCRSISKRSASDTTGDTSRQFVVDGNRLNSRCGLVCAIAHMMGVHWVIEQPGSSLFFESPPMAATIQHCAAQSVKFPMGDYGHGSRKPTILVGTVAWLPQFAQKPKAKQKATTKPKQMDKPKAKKNDKPKATPKAKSTLVTRWHQGGTTKVRGNSNLKESQVYPVQFALAVVRAQWPELAKR